jgi:hypothetical protein
MSTLNPDLWLTSTFDALTDYITGEIDGYVKDNLNADAGLNVFEISFDFPAADGQPVSAEIDKTIIHFIVDDIDNGRLGFGQQYVSSVETVEGGVTSVVPAEARPHVVNFDVGIWASDQSGGTTARLRAYEMLDKLLASDIARRKCADATDGVEIRSFRNGRFITDTINDIRVFRVVGAELVVRVYGRDIDAPAVVVDEEPDVDPDVVIDDNLQING